MKGTGLGAIGVCLVGLTACAVYKNPLDNAVDDGQNARPALMYYLPQGLVTIEAKKNEVPLEEKIEEVTWATATNGTVSQVTRTRTVTTNVVAGGSVTFSDAQIVPDLAARPRYARYAPNWTSDDNVSISVNALGLLSTASATTQDRTGDILVSVAELFGMGVGALGPGVMSLVPADTTTPKPLFKVTVDLSKTNDLNLVNGLLSNWNYRIEGQTKACAAVTGKVNGRDGLVFRELKAFHVWKTDSGTNRSLVRTYVVPNSQRETIFPVNRGFLVEKKTKVSIENGMLRGFDITKPSEVNALVTLPSKLIGSFFKGLHGVLVYQVQPIQDQTMVLKAQSELIKAELELEKQKAAAKAQDADQ